MKKYSLLMIGLIILSMALINGCGSNATGGGGGGGSSTIANRVGTYLYAGTQAPGDVWSWTISTSEFSGTNETTGSWITGEWTTLASGFGKMHVIGSSTIDAVGKYAYFVEYKDTALIVIPVGESNNPIVCAVRASAALTTSPKYITVRVPHKGIWLSTDAAYDTAEVTWAGNTASFDVTEYRFDGSIKQHGTDTLNFSNGRLTSITGGSEEIFLTPAGMFIVDNGSGEGGAIGVSVESFSSIEAANHEYRGLVFDYYPSGTSESYFIAATKNASITGSLTGYMYKDNNIESGTDLTKFVTFNFITQESTGIISTEVIEGSNTTAVKSVIAKIGVGSDKKYIWYGFNVNGSGRPENFLFIQTD